MIGYDLLKKLSEDELRELVVKYGAELDVSKSLVEAQWRMIRDLESAYNNLNRTYNCVSDQKRQREETLNFMFALEDKYFGDKELCSIAEKKEVKDAEYTKL